MGFYESIAEYYDDIFPLDEAQVDFVKGACPPPYARREILDVGCGTGNLAVALAREGFRVTAVDLDQAMVEKAAEKGRAAPHLRFRQLDMRVLSSAFPPGSFDKVLCFGNTLVHLEKQSDVLSFLKAGRELLRGEGSLLLQILNYDRILAKRLPGLPTIENDRIKFERIYRYPEEHHILFRTVLTVKASGAVVENEVPLYPLKVGEMEMFLKEAGFSEIRFFGSFRRDPLTPDSLPLVTEAG
jgi:SAM-dependent methyltransferase